MVNNTLSEPMILKKVMVVTHVPVNMVDVTGVQKKYVIKVCTSILQENINLYVYIYQV